MKKTITVFDKECYDGEWPPERAADCLLWFVAKLDSIPSEFRDSAAIEFDSASGYEGCHYAQIKITYERPETGDEIAAREADARQRTLARIADYERRLARLRSEADGDEKS